MHVYNWPHSLLFRPVYEAISTLASYTGPFEKSDFSNGPGYEAISTCACTSNVSVKTVNYLQPLIKGVLHLE